MEKKFNNPGTIKKNDYEKLKKELRKKSYLITVNKNFDYASTYIIEKKLYRILCEAREESPLISIIIPFYCSEDTIIESVKRLMAVRFSFKHEVILIDDGSPDIASETLHLNFHNLITLIRIESNFGPATARNIGVKFSRGKILCFLDSDQYISDSKILEEIIKRVNEKTIISYLVTKEDGEPITWPMQFPTLISWTLSLFIPRKFYRGVARPISSSITSTFSDWNGINFVIHKDIFPFFEERYYGEDIDIFKRLSNKGIKNLFINKSPVTIFQRGIQAQQRIGKARYTLFQAKIVYARRYFKPSATKIFLIILLLWGLITSLKELLLHIPNNFFRARYFYRLGAFGLHKVWFW
ncbi:MAG: glycosyltransferase family 2 protein [Planctomycetota bacterium]